MSSAAPTALVVEALRAEADRRTRAALGAAVALEQQRTGTGKRDVRAQAVRLVTFLAGAGQLSAEADRFERLAAMTPQQLAAEAQRDTIAAVLTSPAPVPGDTVVYEQVPDDGLSADAHRIAALAGLEDAVIPGDAPAVEDELGTLPEDLELGPEVDAGQLLGDEPAPAAAP